MLAFLRTLGQRHEALKQRIHSFRYPLSPGALNVVRVVYFCTPIYLGHQLMMWALRVRDSNLGVGNEKLLAAIEKRRRPSPGSPAAGTTSAAAPAAAAATPPLPLA
jgi:hypothetical protein